MTDMHEAFTYGQAEEMIARVIGVEDQHRPALRARLRHLRNIGVPHLERPGSGKKINYSDRMILEMLSAVTLEFGGQTPRLAAEIAKIIWNPDYDFKIPENKHLTVVWAHSPDPSGQNAEFAIEELDDDRTFEQLIAEGRPLNCFILNTGDLWRRYQLERARILG